MSPSPLLAPAFPPPLDSAPPRFAFDSALDGVPLSGPGSLCSIRREPDSFAGGASEEGERLDLSSVRSLTVLSRERGVDLPVQKWEWERRVPNVLQLSGLALGAALGPAGVIDILIFATLLTLPCRYGTLVSSMKWERDLRGSDRDLAKIRNEIGGMIGGFAIAEAEAARPGRNTRDTCTPGRR
ncbi:MAG TPA: hypothetical protein VLJ37_06575 [bacterium]|nr:hypothetical protein [bacterium]